MQAYPFFIFALFLLICTTIKGAGVGMAVDTIRQYQATVSAMLGCHNALVQYVQANIGVSGTIAAASVDAYLPPGSVDPGSFTYVVTAPGTATTYLTVPARGQAIAITALQKFTNFGVTAGSVTAGNIVARLPNQTVAASPGVPNGVIAVQTIVRNN